MARQGGSHAARRPSERTPLGRTASAATNVVFAPIWLVLWLQHRLRSEHKKLSWIKDDDFIEVIRADDDEEIQPDSAVAEDSPHTVPIDDLDQTLDRITGTRDERDR